MQKGASLTALMSAFGRAYHYENEKTPVFADSVAKKLLTDEEYVAIGNYILGGMDFFAPGKRYAFRTEKEALGYLVNTQIAPTPLCRAAFCEDALKCATLSGTRAYVILGAGLDTFAFRESGFVQKYPVFEVDLPLTQADKRERIARAGLKVPANLRFVPADLSAGDLGKRLKEAGFDCNKKTLFSWLGVSYYLSDQQIDATLGEIASLCADGSTLVFDYADEGLFSSEVRRVKNMLSMAQAGGEPMKSCFSYARLEKLLQRHGFLIYEQLTPQDIQSRYFSPCGDITAFEHINLVTAVYKG